MGILRKLATQPDGSDIESILQKAALNLTRAGAAGSPPAVEFPTFPAAQYDEPCRLSNEPKSFGEDYASHTNY
jgi:hypothetical protein